MTTITWIIGGVFVVAAVLMLTYFGEQEEARIRTEWQSFVDQNDCHIVENKDAQSGSSVGPAIGFDGKLTLNFQTVSLPAEECWLCNNGRRYWKKAGLAIDRAKRGER
ncbi:hypothetical protein G6M16_007085 [Agrobacterium tumefaciens]|nr:hypothetical protein G6M16_007085 [Agrobacterium tumefaciens]